MLNVAFVSSEISPFASTGGLGDVCGSLPAALAGLGVPVTQFMPMHRRVMEGGFPIENTGIRLSIPVGFHRYQADIWRTRAHQQPAVYFIRRDEFFDRTELYNLPDREYDDNFERFIFFQKAVTALINHLGCPFDIVHANDWQTGLLPLYLHYGLSGEGRSAREKVVFTIHNLSFQGIYGGDYYSYTNLPFSCFSVPMLEYYGNVNCLKGGIKSADVVTTVSQTYAREIQSEATGCGLHGVLQEVSGRLFGIANGIDTNIWNPASDGFIAAPYDHAHLDGKKACKADLIRRCKLKLEPDAPLIGMITRLTPQKGIELVDAALPAILGETNAGLIILGSGTDEMVSMINAWANRWPGRVVARTGFDVKLSHRIEAGADIYLMPSSFEPCGLNQLYSLRYGTVPVVRRVGGLADTVLDVSDDPEHGFGFSFKDFTASALANTVKKAIGMFAQRDVWSAIQQRGMTRDFSWQNSAKQYLDLYRKFVR